MCRINYETTYVCISAKQKSSQAFLLGDSVLSERTIFFTLHRSFRNLPSDPRLLLLPPLPPLLLHHLQTPLLLLLPHPANVINLRFLHHYRSAVRTHLNVIIIVAFLSLFFGELLCRDLFRGVFGHRGLCSGCEQVGSARCLHATTHMTFNHLFRL